MDFIIKNTKWVMLLSGVITASMFYGVLAPEYALKSMFGVSFNGTLEEIIIRSWSSLVGVIGLVLIYGFFSESKRVFCISIASLSKLLFVSLMIIYGQEFFQQALFAIILDSIVILLTIVFLVAIYKKESIV